MVKSDVLVKRELQESLKQAFQKLKDEQADSPDWHPNSGDMVQDLVHPSLYPLVYNRSKVLQDEVVGVGDAVEKWTGKGHVLKTDEVEDSDNQRHSVGLGGSDVPHSYWSSKFQWLPSNASFQDDGSVKLTSYINNLHPTKHPEIYDVVEKLIETALPAWDQCLLEYKDYSKYGPGRKGSRFMDYSGADDQCMENWDPSDPAELADVEVDFSKDVTYKWIEEEELRKWNILRTPVLRDPSPYVDVQYSSYKIDQNPWSKRAEPIVQDSIGRLRRDFKDSGLQVIVKMASIELTPDKPEFPVGGWHVSGNCTNLCSTLDIVGIADSRDQVEGLLNEKICATALYYLDSENITDSSLSFRMQTCYDQDELQSEVGQDSYHWMECVFGTDLSHNGSCLQNYGSVETREGRLLAFPNVL